MNLFALLAARVDIQAQALGVEVELVLATVLLENLSNVTGVLNLTELNVTLALLDSVTDKFGRAGLTLGADNESLLLLAGLVDHECGTLGVLLSDLLGFNSGGELGREGQVLEKGMLADSRVESEHMETYCEGNIIQGNVEAGGAAGQVLANQTGNILALCDKLTGVELSDDTLENLVDNRRKNALIEVLTESTVDLGKSIHTGSGQDTAGDVHHLQVLGTSERWDVARLGADIVDDGCFEPRNLEVSSC